LYFTRLGAHEVCRDKEETRGRKWGGGRSQAISVSTNGGGGGRMSLGARRGSKKKLQGRKKEKRKNRVVSLQRRGGNCRLNSFPTMGTIPNRDVAEKKLPKDEVKRGGGGSLLRNRNLHQKKRLRGLSYYWWMGATVCRKGGVR